MQEILEYLRCLPPEERAAFAKRCGTSIGYLRKAVSVKQQIGVELCIRLERESAGALRCERLYPSLDWSYLRRSALCNKSKPNPGETITTQAPAAIKEAVNA